MSTLADWVGAAAATLMPLVDVIRSHVFAAERIRADDTTVTVLACLATVPKLTIPRQLFAMVRECAMVFAQGGSYARRAK